MVNIESLQDICRCINGTEIFRLGYKIITLEAPSVGLIDNFPPVQRCEFLVESYMGLYPVLFVEHIVIIRVIMFF